MEIIQTPAVPYYAVIFTSIRTNLDNGYESVAEKILALAHTQPGFLGVESVRSGLGITVSYWKDLESIHAWKMNSEHLVAQNRGRSEWYSDFRVRIARVEREYGFD